VRIKQRPTDRSEQRTLAHPPRIVTYIRDNLRFITAKFRACYFCESLNIRHGFTTTAGIF
jgi:hypothetical protein